MRTNLIAVGLLLGAIGAALWYIPLQSGTVGPTTVTSSQKEIVELSAPLNVLGASIPYSASWVAASNVTLRVYDCGGDSSCALAGSGTPTTSGSGSAGTLSWNGHRGEYFAILATGGSPTVVVNYTAPILGGLLGLLIFVFGVIVFLLGVGLSRRPNVVDGVPPALPTAATTGPSGVLDQK